MRRFSARSQPCGCIIDHVPGPTRAHTIHPPGPNCACDIRGRRQRSGGDSRRLLAALRAGYAHEAPKPHGAVCRAVLRLEWWSIAAGAAPVSSGTPATSMLAVGAETAATAVAAHLGARATWRRLSHGGVLGAGQNRCMMGACACHNSPASDTHPRCADDPYRCRGRSGDGGLGCRRSAQSAARVACCLQIHTSDAVATDRQMTGMCLSGFKNVEPRSRTSSVFLIPGADARPAPSARPPDARGPTATRPAPPLGLPSGTHRRRPHGHGHGRGRSGCVGVGRDPAETKGKAAPRPPSGPASLRVQRLSRTVRLMVHVI